MVNNVNKFIMPNGDEIKIDGLYGKITNCLLEVPQRIKLELNDGVLTLKAGSQVIVPNGFEEDGVTPKFDEVVVENDLTMTTSWGTAEKMAIFIRPDATSLYMVGLARSSSGTTAPTTTDTRYWYDTDTNLVKDYRGGSYTGGNRSFPIAICTKTSASNDNLLASIDQIFNGMGYIGSTVWVDKGIKGLIPNGRNEDGTLRNIEVTSDKLYLRTFTIQKASNVYCIFQPNNTERPIGFVYLSNLVSNWEDINYIKDVDGTIYQGFMCATCNMTNGVITSFNPKQPFRAVDYNDKSEISGWSAPSSKYINLTLNASNSTYTAPANGWVLFDKNTSSGKNIVLWNFTKTYGFSVSSSATFGQSILLPVSKGDVFGVEYTATGTTNFFRFIYAQGEV